MIDTDDYAASGIKVITFPGGEIHVEVPPCRTLSVQIFAKIRSWDDFGKLIFVLDAYRQQDVHCHLFMPYLPGARQDRKQAGFALSSAIYAKALDNVTSIMAADVHSHAASAVYRSRMSGGLYEISPSSFVPDILDGEYDFIIAPDAGSVGRATSVARVLGDKVVLQCSKLRDSITGVLSGFEVPDVSPKEYDNKRLLIVDDICDGGGTFIGVADELRKKNSSVQIDLFVTHGIFSAGLDKLASKFQTIYTTNSWCDISHPSLKVLDLLPYYYERLTP